MNYSIYDDARACASELRNVGIQDVAGRLDTAMYGATSGEILGDLSFHISALLESETEIPDELSRRLRTLLDAIHRACHPRARSGSNHGDRGR